MPLCGRERQDPQWILKTIFHQALLGRVLKHIRSTHRAMFLDTRLELSGIHLGVTPLSGRQSTFQNPQAFRSWQCLEQDYYVDLDLCDNTVFQKNKYSVSLGEPKAMPRSFS